MTTLSLYKVADDLAPLLESGIDVESGEISPELGAALATFEGKAEAVTAFILNTDATAQAVRAAAKKLIERAEAMEMRADRLRHYLAFNMKRTGITSICSNDGSFEAKLHIARDASVSIFDEKQIPAEFMRIPEPKPPVPVPNKKAIAEAIKAGIDVPGAKIVKSDRLEIR
jgi:hypothetical protein